MSWYEKTLRSRIDALSWHGHSLLLVHRACVGCRQRQRKARKSGEIISLQKKENRDTLSLSRWSFVTKITQESMYTECSRSCISGSRIHRDFYRYAWTDTLIYSLPLDPRKTDNIFFQGNCRYQLITYQFCWMHGCLWYFEPYVIIILIMCARDALWMGSGWIMKSTHGLNSSMTTRAECIFVESILFPSLFHGRFHGEELMHRFLLIFSVALKGRNEGDFFPYVDVRIKLWGVIDCLSHAQVQLVWVWDFLFRLSRYELVQNRADIILAEKHHPAAATAASISYECIWFVRNLSTFS